MEGLESNSAFYFFTQKTVIIAHLTLAHYRCVCPTTLTYLSATPGFLILILCIFLLTSHLNLLLTLIIHTCQTPNKLICPMKYHFESIRASPMYYVCLFYVSSSSHLFSIISKNFASWYRLTTQNIKCLLLHQSVESFLFYSEINILSISFSFTLTMYVISYPLAAEPVLTVGLICTICQQQKEK